MNCHNPSYPPTPIGYNTHLAHVGKYSAKVDYFTRHPNLSKSTNCADCHKQVFDCTNCHRVGIPHISPPLGNNCQGCHGTIDNLFRHPSINLTIHNIFHLNSTKDCTMCHNPDSMNLLKLASGVTIPIVEDYKLCQQCHSPYYNQWDAGSHYVNKTAPPSTLDYTGAQVADDPKWENAWRKDNSCTNCHNPHNPSELYQLPLMSLSAEKASNVSGTNYLYIGSAISAIVAAVAVGRRYKHEISNLRKLSMPKISMPLPKISLPISISVESVDDPGGQKRDVTLDDHEPEKVENLHDIKEQIKKPVHAEKTEIIKKKQGQRGNILFVMGILILLGSAYAFLGSIWPLVVITSGSMSPHIQIGDIIIYQDISRINDINLHINSRYLSMGDYGDVIIYKPYGGSGTPYIHRAMYYVEKGQAMWSGGPAAPFAGYITQGDANTEYDQQIANSYNQPVKKEWIIGIARYRIPYLGYLRMWL
jgi:signal peptidase